MKNQSASISIALILLWVLACLAVSCSGAGGKGLTRHLHDSMEESSPGGDFALSDAPAMAPQSESQETRYPSENDPFGLMPVDWPEDVRLHPHAYVAYSGNVGDGGSYIMTLISPDFSTLPGVQGFHIDSLRSWESIEIDEEFEGDYDEVVAITIVAEREDELLRIVIEQGVLNRLPDISNQDHWRSKVGDSPIVVRMIYVSADP